MITMTSYIDTVKKKLRINATAKLALLVGVQGEHLRRVHKQKMKCSDELAVKLAKLIDDDPEKALIIAGYSNTTERGKQIWKEIFRRWEQYKNSKLVLAGKPSSLNNKTKNRKITKFAPQ